MVGARVFFFLLWPLFARAPRHWFLENFLLSAPGVQRVFFFVALRWAPRPFGGARAKKKTPPRVFFFFAPAPGKGRGRRSPVPTRGQSKKKHHPGCVFLLRPRRKAREGVLPCLSPGPEQKKNTLGGVFFFALAPCRRPTGLLLPCLSPGRSKKINTLGGVFFLLRPRADAHSLTAGLGGDASPSPGWCFLFAAAPPGPGWCFFFCCGPARTLTHSLWAGAISARPGWCFFFAAAPPGLFRQ